MMLIMSTAIVKRLKQIGDDAVVRVVDIVVVDIAIVIHDARVVVVVVVRRPQPPTSALRQARHLTYQRTLPYTKLVHHLSQLIPFLLLPFSIFANS